MNDSTSEVLRQAVEWARERQAPVLLASTSGVTAEKILSLLRDSKVPLTVVNHDGPSAPKDWWFRPDIRKKLRDAGHTVLSAKTGLIPPALARWVTKTFGIAALTGKDRALEEILGTGGRVCFKIAKQAIERGIVRTGEAVVAVAGRVTGADTALALRVTQTSPPRMALLEIISRPPSETG
ncbi:MAG: hypothetical protein HYU34_02195 [Candidatus Omnitrophica bacterium]|nr:hypothetical protein [Candidatus Omnitrophota bacterium]